MLEAFFWTRGPNNFGPLTHHNALVPWQYHDGTNLQVGTKVRGVR